MPLLPDSVGKDVMFLGFPFVHSSEQICYHNMPWTNSAILTKCTQNIH